VSISQNLKILRDYSARMAKGDYCAVYETFAPEFESHVTARVAPDAYYGVQASGERVTINGTAILRMKDGKVAEHWGGPHCANGIGLSPGFTLHAAGAH
jgi:ketosteroid isomerase-like protein